MACEEPKEEWTISTETDQTGDKGLLIFCLSIDGNEIEGEVHEAPVDADGNVTGEPSFLSTVTGHDDEVPGLNISFMTLNFTWGSTKVVMAGNRFRAHVPNTFRGRFAAFGAAEFARQAAATAESSVTITPQAPGDGDTGTGTGTQT